MLTQVEGRARELLDPGHPLVVLLSGGRDSVCLLDLAVRFAGPVTALHVNYGLRPGADGDEVFCAELCERLGVGLDSVRAGPPAGNVQAWARELRYAEAERLARPLDALVATGHTATDQVETVLYRLAASPGRRALLGMRAREGRVVRPLLGSTREETAGYCRERGLAWREDPTNESDAYARGRVRHGLVPALRAVHPAADANVLRTLALLRDEAAVLDEVAAAAAEPPEVARLAALPPALARLAVQWLADRAAGVRAPALGGRVEEILTLGAGGGSASLDVGGGLRAVVEYGVLRFAAGQPAPPPAAAVLPVPGRAVYGAGTLACEESADGPLDADRLGARLEARPWRAGDRIRLQAGSRSLQDLFTDHRVPRERRPQLPVVLAEGEVAWVAGVATGERFAATPASRRRVRLSWDQGVPSGTSLNTEWRVGRGWVGNPIPKRPSLLDCAPRMLQDDKIGEILVQADELQHRIKQMAAEISRDYAGKDLLLIGVLKGAVFFLADLMRHLDMHCEVDFMAVASYGSSTESSGVVRILKDLDEPLEGRHVLIVEDIVDSGLTLQYLMRTLEARGPASLEVCALLTKPERRRVETPARYVGFEIPDRFAIGYGLDYAERYRNLPYVAALTGIAD
ncbi:MAG TPA: hypoxanthine phosphoribosyltransferase [Solirubrobacteraceae bacterium]|nr:hypoxanthine phosphoribosyltransferase [Solirubrobacteraceae bacterium]